MKITSTAASDTGAMCENFYSGGGCYNVMSDFYRPVRGVNTIHMALHYTGFLNNNITEI